VRDVNMERLRTLAGQLRSAVRELEEYRALDPGEFAADRKTVNSAKYLLIVATEAALDICNHLAARRGGRSPADYADCFVILAELGVIGDDLRTRLVRMARFRNLLVHLYWKVDDREVHRIIRENLSDLDDYLEAVGLHLGRDLE
jgi:uncharacterized protein YutE (UPF0331/DUF86 family)